MGHKCQHYGLLPLSFTEGLLRAHDGDVTEEMAVNRTELQGCQSEDRAQGDA